MDTKEFKKLFSAIAKKNGFTFEFNAFFKESDRCVIALILRKSSFSKLFHLRIKVKLKEPSETFHEKQEWVKHDVADILLGADEKFKDFFDLENLIADKDRIVGIENLFTYNLIELIGNALTQEGLLDLYNSGKIILFPSTKLKLGVH